MHNHRISPKVIHLHNPVIPAIVKFEVSIKNEVSTKFEVSIKKGTIAKFEVSIKKGNYTNYGIIAIVPAIVEFESYNLYARLFKESPLYYYKNEAILAGFWHRGHRPQ